MRAGRLRHKLRIESATKTRTASGGYTDTWATLATVFGAVEPIRGREYQNADQQHAETTHKITIRWRAGITAANRVVMVNESRTFDVMEARNVSERDRTIELLAKETTA